MLQQGVADCAGGCTQWQRRPLSARAELLDCSWLLAAPTAMTVQVTYMPLASSTSGCLSWLRVCVLGVCCVRLQVTAVEAGALLGLYVVYVCVTFYTSRADEPLHADLALHEFPPEDGGIGECTHSHSPSTNIPAHVRQQRGSCPAAAVSVRCSAQQQCF